MKAVLYFTTRLHVHDYTITQWHYFQVDFIQFYHLNHKLLQTTKKLYALHFYKRNCKKLWWKETNCLTNLNQLFIRFTFITFLFSNLYSKFKLLIQIKVTIKPFRVIFINQARIKYKLLSGEFVSLFAYTIVRIEQTECLGQHSLRSESSCCSSTFCL